MAAHLSADLVLRGGRIATLDGAGDKDVGGSLVEALAAQGGRIVALGRDSDVEGLIGPGTEILELDGRTVVPGIVDSHCHPDSYGIKLLKQQPLNPPLVTSREDLLALIDRKTRELPADAWFTGYRFNDQRAGGYPTRTELNAHSNGRPVFILRTDNHIGIANSRACELCGITSDSPDPPFGRFDRDPESGELTGLMRETAAQIFRDRMARDDTVEEVAAGLERVFDECLSFGITSLTNSLAGSKTLRALQTLKAEERLRLRVGILANGFETGLIESFIKAGIRSGFGDDWLRVIGVEWCPDCSTSGRTAAYYDPYVGEPVVGEPQPNTGMLLYEAEDLTARVVAAHKAGLQVCVEGVGDRGIDFALDAIEAALQAEPRPDHRMRVEHCCYVTPAIQDRLARLEVIDSSASGFMYDLGEAYRRNRGAEAMRHMWPHRSLIDRGIPAPGHSDSPVCQANPFFAIWSLVTRRSETGACLDPAEAIGVAEALRAYTVLGAYSGREETIKGSLKPGMLADLAVLDRDIFSVPADHLRETQVTATVVDGRLAFRR